MSLSVGASHERALAKHINSVMAWQTILAGPLGEDGLPVAGAVGWFAKRVPQPIQSLKQSRSASVEGIGSGDVEVKHYPSGRVVNVDSKFSSTAAGFKRLYEAVEPNPYSPMCPMLIEGEDHLAVMTIEAFALYVIGFDAPQLANFAPFAAKLVGKAVRGYVRDYGAVALKWKRHGTIVVADLTRIRPPSLT